MYPFLGGGGGVGMGGRWVGMVDKQRWMPSKCIWILIDVLYGLPGSKYLNMMIIIIQV